jgi:hypothetical protein
MEPKSEKGRTLRRLSRPFLHFKSDFSPLSMYPLVRRGDLRPPSSQISLLTHTQTEAGTNDNSRKFAGSLSPVPDLSILCVRFVTTIIESGFAAKQSEAADPSICVHPQKLAPGAGRRKLFNSKARYVLYLTSSFLVDFRMRSHQSMAGVGKRGRFQTNRGIFVFRCLRLRKLLLRVSSSGFFIANCRSIFSVETHVGD